MIFQDDRPVDPTRVSAHTYRVALGYAQFVSDQIRQSTTASADILDDQTAYYLSPDSKSGFGVGVDGTLIGLFSLVKGRGRDLMAFAHSVGAWRLDCFDGFLPGFYKSLGWVETRREANWTPGGPDVVYMAFEDALIRV